MSDPKASFFTLTPEKILSAVESVIGIRATGRVQALASYENRVYLMELEEPYKGDPWVVAKFYRPNRWTREQILEEHRFLLELFAEEIPVCAPLHFSSQTLFSIDHELQFGLFPKIKGRSPDELDGSGLAQVGRLLARIHTVGSRSKAPSRITIHPQTYGLDALDFLLTGPLPEEHRDEFSKIVREICKTADPLFKNLTTHRIHGDCHRGNLLFNQAGYFFLDFDDMLMGPAIQDLWLIEPGRDEHSQANLELVLEGYQQLRPFAQTERNLIEVLRALRMIHFTAWIARRWDDPSFPQAYPHFGTRKYWDDQITDLKKQLELF